MEKSKLNVVSLSGSTGSSNKDTDSGRSAISLLETLGVTVLSLSGAEEIQLKDIQYGETVVGDMTSSEKRLFYTLFSQQKLVDSLQKQLSGSTIIGAGQAIRDGMEEKEMMDIITNSVSEEEALAYFKNMRLLDLIKSTYLWALCERVGVHGHTVGIRSKFRIVKGERKW